MHPARDVRTTILVSLVNALGNGGLAIAKILIGSWGYSHALIADGIHSLSDLATDGLVFVAARMGAQEPDKEHPYGHRRIETLAAIIISLVLILVAVGIAYHTLPHFTHTAPKYEPNIWVIIFAGISVIANEGLFRYTLFYSRKIYSDLLRSYAWHNRSDAFVSLLVVISAIGARFGLSYLDSIGAWAIAALILVMGIKMMSNNIKELIDTGVDKNTLQALTHAILSVPHVNTIHQLRTRSHGGHIFVDVHIQVNPMISVSEGHYIGEQVLLLLKKQFARIIDVTVHIDSENDATSMPSLYLPDRNAINQLLKKYCEHLPGFHDIRRLIIHYLNGELMLELYMPFALAKTTDAENLETQYTAALNSEKNIKYVKIYFGDE